MKRIGVLIDNLVPVISWGLAIFLVVYFFGFGLDFPANFLTLMVVFTLMLLIHQFLGKIKDLEKEIERKDAIFSALDQYELGKAIKKAEDNGE